MVAGVLSFRVKLVQAIKTISFFVFAGVILFAMEEAMLHFSHPASIIGPPLAIAALLAFVTPAGAGISLNGVSLNGVALNGVALNGIAVNGISTTGSALGDLNGVAVEAVVISDAVIR